MTARLTALFGLLWLLAGCTTPVKGLYQEESFSYPNVQRGGLGVGGVVNAVDPGAYWEPMQRVGYAEVLWRALRDETEGLPLTSALTLSEAIGEENWRALLDRYRAQGRLDPAGVALIGAHYHGARYLVLARLERNEVSREESDETKPQTEYDRKLKQEVETGRMERTRTRTTRRQLGASFQVLDLQNGGHTVWSGAIEKSASEQASKSDLYDPKRRLAETIIDGLLQGDPPEFPEPPSFDALVERLFTGFAENMPKAD